jgi:alcohol dehydrogenase
MKAAVFPAPDTVGIADVPEPALESPTDAIMRVTAAAICGSDLRSIRITEGDDTWPIGHEFAGEVVEVGAGLKYVQAGERYHVPMYTVCGRCSHCLTGRQNECPDTAVFGSSHKYSRHPGGQADFVRIPNADLTLGPIPDGADDDDMVLFSDILPTAFTVLDAVHVSPGERVLVVGCGPVGQLLVMCAPFFGAAEIYAVDLDPARLELAASYGAEPLAAGDGLAERLKDATGGRGVDVAIDATGNPAALKDAFESLVARGGRVGAVNGNVGEPFPFTPNQLFARRASVTTTIGNPYRWRQKMTDLVASGRLQPGRIVSDRIPLTEAPAAFEKFKAREANKIVLLPAGAAA